MTSTLPTALTRGAAETARLLRGRELSSRELVAALRSRIEQVNPAVNALRAVCDDARDAAAAADRRLAAGEPIGPLDGVPITVKDNVDVRGQATTQGVRALAGAVAADDAPAVAHLRRAGAIVLGRTTMPDFALRWHTDGELTGPTRNPFDPAVTPGGSSGGEAVALATGMSLLGVGTDLGGSLRWPSQCAGTAALRPGLGRIPQASAPDGSPPIGLQLLDVTGPMARRVEDLRLALEIMSRPDPRDPWHVPPGARAPTAGVRRVHRLDPAGDDVDPAVRVGLDRAADALSAAGYRIDDRPPPGLDQVEDTWAGLMAGDARHLWPGIEPITGPDGRRFMDAMFAVAPDLGPDGYRELFMTRNRLGRAWGEYLADTPLVLAPIFAGHPFAPGDDLDGVPAARRIVRGLRSTLVANLLGLPAVAVPVGLVDGRPMAVQLIGPRFAEHDCLDAAEVVEAATGAVTPIDPVPAGPATGHRPARA